MTLFKTSILILFCTCLFINAAQAFEEEPQGVREKQCHTIDPAERFAKKIHTSLHITGNPSSLEGTAEEAPVEEEEIKILMQETDQKVSDSLPSSPPANQLPFSERYLDHVAPGSINAGFAHMQMHLAEVLHAARNFQRAGDAAEKVLANHTVPTNWHAKMADIHNDKLNQLDKVPPCARPQ